MLRQYPRWDGTKNSALLRLAEASFQVFVTADQNLQYQQNLKSAKLAIVLLVAPSNRLETLRPLMPQALTALESIQAGDVVRIEMRSP